MAPPKVVPSIFFDGTTVPVSPEATPTANLQQRLPAEANRFRLPLLSLSPESNRPVNSPTSHRRLEVDREDLMREATALRQRAEFRLPQERETVIAGYRSSGSLSVYFGPDPCFHFDAAGRLRRAFVGGDLFRTQGDTVARLQRIRTGGTVELRRHDLPADELDAFLDMVRDRLASLVKGLQSDDAHCLQEIPADAHLAERLVGDLSRIVAGPLSLAPPIAGRP